MTRLLIAVPCYEQMRVEFAQSLLGLVAQLHADGIEHEVKIIAGSLVHIARDRLARHAVNHGFSHVLWIDSDMVFSPSIAEDLLDTGKAMVCGRFISRHSPYLQVIFKSIERSRVERYMEADIPDDIFRIAGCGFGCVLMRMEVLRDVLQGNHGQAFLPTPELGEDLAFCERAVGAGYEIWCEPTVRVGHVGAVTIWPEDARRLQGDIQGLDGKELN